MLCFTLNKGASHEIKENWIQLSSSITQDRAFRDAFLTQWAASCTMDSNKALPLLDRCEGGLGDTDNLVAKQLRGNREMQVTGRYMQQTEITFRFSEAYERLARPGVPARQRWTADEKLDLKETFIRLALDIIKADGGIKGVNRRIR